VLVDLEQRWKASAQRAEAVRDGRSAGELQLRALANGDNCLGANGEAVPQSPEACVHWRKYLQGDVMLAGSVDARSLRFMRLAIARRDIAR
jgi:hypothetical protein